MPSALLITSSTSTPPADAVWVRDRLISQGWTVTLASRNDAAYDFTGRDLVVVDGSVNPTQLGTKVDAAPCGCLGLYVGPHSKYATNLLPVGGAASNTLYVLPAANGDVLVGANTGTITNQSNPTPTAPQYYTDTTLGSGAVKVLATTSGQLTRIVGSRYPQGGLLSDGTTQAPSRRIHLGFQPGLTNLTPIGVEIFDNSVAHAAASPINQAPIVNAGPDLVVQAAGTPTSTTHDVVLNGSATDPEGGALTYLWTLATSTGSATLLSPTSPSATLRASKYGFSGIATLTVTDSLGVSGADSASVQVNAVANLRVASGGALLQRQLFAVKAGLLT